MKVYVAKYYPLIDGKEKEYTTTVQADNKVVAESMIRKAFVEQLEKMQRIMRTFNMNVIGYNVDELLQNIEYAKSNMRVVIM